MSKASVRSLVLGIWTGFFLWLIVTGEMDRYVGSRTRWVVFFGAVAIGMAALLQARAAAAGRGKHRVDRSEGIGVAALLMPLVLVLAIPEPRLGASAAARKTLSGASGAAFVPAPDATGRISFPEITYATRSSEYAAALGIVEGFEVELVGFVTHPEGTDGGFALTRFQSFCCAADAVPFSVPVDPGSYGDHPDDTWLRVSGSLVRNGETLLIQAAEVELVEEPSDPYI